MKSPHAAPLLILGLVLWIFGGLLAVYGPDPTMILGGGFANYSPMNGSTFGRILGLAGLASIITGVVLHLRAGGR